jgi:hypothetical protein
MTDPKLVHTEERLETLAAATVFSPGKVETAAAWQAIGGAVPGFVLACPPEHGFGSLSARIQAAASESNDAPAAHLNQLAPQAALAADNWAKLEKLLRGRR